jgi:hypothetical protein
MRMAEPQNNLCEAGHTGFDALTSYSLAKDYV